MKGMVSHGSPKSKLVSSSFSPLFRPFCQCGTKPREDGNSNSSVETGSSQDPIMPYSSMLQEQSIATAQESDPLRQVHREQVVNSSFPQYSDSSQYPSVSLNGNLGNCSETSYYLHLYNATLQDDWGAADSFLLASPDAVNTVITPSSETALHLAVSSGHTIFAKKLVELMSVESLAIRETTGGTTALSIAAATGNTEIAKAMVRKNSNLTQMVDKQNWSPVLIASYYATKERKDILSYLCNETRNEDPSPFSGVLGGKLICFIVEAGFFDIALSLVDRYPNLAYEDTEYHLNVLKILARASYAFPSGSQLGFWQRCIYSTIPLDDEHSKNRSFLEAVVLFILMKFFLWNYLTRALGYKDVYRTKYTHLYALRLADRVIQEIATLSSDKKSHIFTGTDIVYVAAEHGIVELVTQLLRWFPNHMEHPKENRSIFHVAVEHRREKIFSLLARDNIRCTYNISYLDNVSGNNILHLAAMLAPSPRLKSVSGAALQMQRELQWYKEVEKRVPPVFAEMRNSLSQRPRDLFTEEHKDLVEKGEKWMKDTAQYCMLVATLIATVVFTAAFTVPGGNISGDGTDTSNDGIPIFLHRRSFTVFIVSDAIALFTSTTSVLTFLSILTSRCAEQDFLYALPKRLIIGLATLFLSIAAMMVAFSATLDIILSRKYAGASIPVTAVACLPVILFLLLQLPLFLDIVFSTYLPGIFRAQSKYKLD